MHGNANMNTTRTTRKKSKYKKKKWLRSECLHFSDDDDVDDEENDNDDDNLCHLPMCACKNSNKYMDMEYNVAAAFWYSTYVQRKVC